MKFSAALVGAALLSTSVMAHPGGHHVSHAELSRRAELSKRCSGAVADLNKKRFNKRMMAKRDLAERAGNATYQITTEAPHYTTIQNDTCVLTPDVTQGPYIWPRSQTLRQDMSEDQPGVPLWLDVGVLNMATCEPLPNALVSFWHCNATGSYASFTALSPNTPFVTLLGQLNISESDFEIGKTDLHTDDTTFLRGMWPTDSEGVMEMKTIFPGFYVQRAIHIHTQVFTDWVLHDNGTISSGDLHSTGQLYFDEDIEQQLMALEPYVSHTEINRTLNSEDALIHTSRVNGFNPVVNIVPADGENIENGVIGYVTLGVDLNSSGINETVHS